MTPKTSAFPSWVVCRSKHYTQGTPKTNCYFWNYCGTQLHYPKICLKKKKWTSGSYPLLLIRILWYQSFCKLYLQVIHRLINVWELLPCCSLMGLSRSHWRAVSILSVIWDPSFQHKLLEKWAASLEPSGQTCQTLAEWIRS